MSARFGFLSSQWYMPLRPTSSCAVKSSTTSPFVRTFAASIARAACSRLATDALLSKTPGAWSWSPFRVTFTSVSIGCTVSRCAANTTVGPPPVPRRVAMTLPISSTVTVRPSVSSSVFT
jgi:hypothetical protein